MTLINFQKLIQILMKDPKNHDKELIGDVKPGLKITGMRLYGEHFVAIYDEREP